MTKSKLSRENARYFSRHKPSYVLWMWFISDGQLLEGEIAAIVLGVLLLICIIVIIVL